MMPESFKRVLSELSDEVRAEALSWLIDEQDNAIKQIASTLFKLHPISPIPVRNFIGYKPIGDHHNVVPGQHSSKLAEDSVNGIFPDESNPTDKPKEGD